MAENLYTLPGITVTAPRESEEPVSTLPTETVTAQRPRADETQSWLEAYQRYILEMLPRVPGAIPATPRQSPPPVPRPPDPQEGVEAVPRWEDPVLPLMQALLALLLPGLQLPGQRHDSPTSTLNALCQERTTRARMSLPRTGVVRRPVVRRRASSPRIWTLCGSGARRAPAAIRPDFPPQTSCAGSSTST